jgi:nucleolar protein 53
MSIKTVNKPSVEAPKKNKGASKKNKKSWRKNTSIEDIEEFLDDQRLEERLGGAFDKRKDEDIFMVDSKSQKEAEKEGKTTAVNK